MSHNVPFFEFFLPSPAVSTIIAATAEPGHGSIDKVAKCLTMSPILPPGALGETARVYITSGGEGFWGKNLLMLMNANL
jgi:hypothetical protein